MTREKWLVTGGCGFLGSNLVAALLADGHDVIAFDNLSRRGAAENLVWLSEGCGRRTRHFTFVYGDVRDQNDTELFLREHGSGATALAHVAGQVAMTTSVARPRLDFETNALGTLNILEAVRRFAPDAAVLFSSSNKVYGDLKHLRYIETATRWTLPDFPYGLDETLPLDFRTPYGCSKGAADQYSLDYYRMYGVRSVVFRHSSMYGGRQFATSDQGWVGWFSAEVLRHKTLGTAAHEIQVSGDGKQVRDILHSSDVVRAYRAAAASIDTVAGEVFNLGGGVASSLSIRELLALLCALTGTHAPVQFGEWRRQDQRVFIANNSRAQERLDWRPTMDVTTGLREMIAWVSRKPTDRAGAPV